MAKTVAGVDLAPGVGLYNILNGIPDTTGVAINCTVGRGHRFTSSELHQVLCHVLAETYDLDDTEQNGPYYLQIRIERQKALIGFRLSERTRGPRAGDLSASTASAIGVLFQPERNELWLDPMCRGGAVLRSLAEIQEIQGVGLEVRGSWTREDRSSHVGLWDGKSLPCREGTFAGVFGHFGRRSGMWLDIDLQSEFARVLGKHGRAIILCGRDRELESHLQSERSPFRCSERRSICIGGDLLSLYLLRKV